MKTPRSDAADVFQPGMRFCWLSGWGWNYRPNGWYGPNGLQIAHIASGGGSAVRVNDRRAVISLSPLAHALHVSDADALPEMDFGGKKYPTIDERHSLYLKEQIDPEYYDLEFLRHYWIGEIPEPEPPPEAWRTLLLDNQGVFV